MNDANRAGLDQALTADHVAHDFPERIGRYRVERVLGEGGFGIVYLANDEQLQRLVAIKVPHKQLLARSADAEAYLTEARTVANLDHPNIVPVHDVGSADDFPFFIVAKYIDGTDLAARLRVSPLSILESAELIATVAEALHHAHKQGLVHRDVKPGNILLDKNGKAFIGDFGLALREQDVGKGPRFAGTPAYMSPEQARGEGHRVDGRSDIFSLGVVLYELLTGRRPFQGDTEAELLQRVKAAEPRPPRQLDDTIPKELERICLKALAKRASDRYTTAKDIADDLHHWIADDGSSHLVEAKAARSGLDGAAAAPSVGKSVFISYATPDQEAAQRLVHVLEERGVGCWIAPRDVSPGADYGEAIIRAIEAAPTTVLLLSAHANLSIHVTHEVERATSKRKRVIPVRLENVEPGPALELHLATAHWVDAWRFSLEQVAAQLAVVVRGEGPPPLATPVGSSLPTPRSDGQPVKIVPKGPRAFDAHDADFFLELVPGPRDRDGLPDSIRFWKTRIEETDRDNTFSVGLIYGPSGCGKSSLVKAGLLPRLSADVIAIHVDATAEDTEKRLLSGLRKRFPGTPAHWRLTEMLASLRQGAGIAGGKKVLMVLDQFEQWLHAKKPEENAELVQSLRQCDGARVQCVIMVRDDFWLAVSRFLKALEVRLVEGQNSALVDLFHVDHARKVLAAFGRAFCRLPVNTALVSREQKQFLKQAVAELAQDGKVVCVRLALFAEMVKGKDWTAATLKAVGGSDGVGVMFLQETFAAATAPAENRYHQKAARAVLKALLPEAGAEIKGHMRSHRELLEASGYATRADDFEDLIRILNSQVRLITPTDPEGKLGGDDSPAPAPPGEKYYQLTHDYLVPSLRDWLTRKQKETRRGRAELRLEKRAAAWEERREARFLPAWWEWLNIRLLTRKPSWTASQRTMMGQAARYHAVRGAVLVAIVALLAFLGLVVRDRIVDESNASHAAALVQRLVVADIDEVPPIVKEMAGYRLWADPLLRQTLERTKQGSRQEAQIRLALLPVDADQVGPLYRHLLRAGPDVLPVIRDGLHEFRDDLKGPLWQVLENGAQDPDRGFRAACALADFDANESDANRKRWESVAPFVAERFLAAVKENPSHYAPLLRTLQGIRGYLLGPLADVFRSMERPEVDRTWATSVLAEYAGDQPALLTDYLLDAQDKQFALLLPRAEAYRAQLVAACYAALEARAGLQADEKEKERLAKRQANGAVILFRLGQYEKVWPLLKHGPDPRARSYLVHRLGQSEANPSAVVKRLAMEEDLSIQRALILALASFGDKAWQAEEREPLLTSLRDIYRKKEDPGLHAAAEWLLQAWGQQPWLRQTNDAWVKDDANRKQRLADIQRLMANAKEEAAPQWYVDGQGQTMVVLPGTLKFLMGSPASEYKRVDHEPQHYKRIPRSFAVAAKPVTVAEFKRFDESFKFATRFAPEPNCPVVAMSWFQAAIYCNWLSAREGISKDQWCYEEKDGLAVSLMPNYLSLTGYRLPTETEWEFACRAGARTARYYGETEELLEKYAWYLQDSSDRSWPVGTKKPNDWGLFDMHGNASNWCQDRFTSYPQGDTAKVYDDREDILTINSEEIRIVRAGSFFNAPRGIRCADRNVYSPIEKVNYVGFRVVRTIVAY